MTITPEHPSAATPAEVAPVATPETAGRARRGRRGGRARASQEAGAAPETAPPAHKNAPRSARSHPLLAQLAAWYPALFGEPPLPLKRGIFQDLIAAHGDALEPEQLKAALAIHTRGTRYLGVVAAGQPRHDLQGQPVETMAPEHVHHALLEVFRRRQQRSSEDLTPKLRARIAAAFEASGLAREAYDALARGRDERANALLDEALALVGERAARAEALLRAFDASGQSEVEFAQMYGLHPREVAEQLARARRAQG